MGSDAANEEPADERGGRGWWIVAGVSVALVVVLGIVVVRLRSSSPAPAPTLSAGNGSPDTKALSVAELAGDWRLADDGQSWAGYRIDETYLGIPAPETVTARTPNVKATLTVADGKVTAVQAEADTRSLASDDPKRDAAMKGSGLETDRYPAATFRLTEPVALPGPASATPTPVHVRGELTLHGTAQPVEVDLQAQVIPGEKPVLEIVGSHPVVLRDHGIEPPSVAGLLDVADNGAFELKLRFVRS